MHAGLLTHVVVIEMSWADSLSDAVRQQVHFGRTHPEYQLTKAPWLHIGHRQLKNNSCVDLQMHINVVCVRVWPLWPVCESVAVWVWASHRSQTILKGSSTMVIHRPVKMFVLIRTVERELSHHFGFTCYDQHLLCLLKTGKTSSTSRYYKLCII